MVTSALALWIFYMGIIFQALNGIWLFWEYQAWLKVSFFNFIYKSKQCTEYQTKKNFSATLLCPQRKQ